MKVVRAACAGACYGVTRALEAAYAAAKHEDAAYSLGPLIHNPQVVSDLARAGVDAVSSLEELPNDASAVIIRSHGVAPQVARELSCRGLPIIDATCPHVSRAQEAARELGEAGMQVLVVGEDGHPEVEALVAYAQETGAQVVVVADTSELPSDLHEPVGIVVQTTQKRSVLDAVVLALRARGIEPVVKNTICAATSQRQDAARDVAQTVDAMVVVGGRNSSNTTRLAEICAEVCPRTFHIEGADELCEAAFQGCDTVGVTAGASTPEAHIAAVVERLEAMDVHAGACAARIVRVEPESPADDAGFSAGCVITHVEGRPLRDMIDWRWYACDDEVELGFIDCDGDVGSVVLEREPGQDWGIEFDGLIFDHVKLCRNACSFCFMRQLPQDMRESLSLRDDDFRLSFLSGTFVTLTNITPDDEARILEQHLSPLRVSLHAVDPQVRRRMIGKHAAHGLEVFERLLAAGIEAHVQIVLVPKDNDGAVLQETLQWAYAHPGILSVGIVPVGFTRHQTWLEESFTDASAARRVIEDIAPFQRRALDERDSAWVFAADEFYVNAFRDTLLDHLPPARHYGDFSLFEDGIGIIRSYVDDWEAAQSAGLVQRCADILRARGIHARFVVGEAMQPFLDQLVARSPLAGVFEPLTVTNDYFGGNVNVTGLLCGCDVASAIRAASGDAFFIPSVMLNDDGLTLDDMSCKDMEDAATKRIAVVSCNASEFLEEIAKEFTEQE